MISYTPTVCTVDRFTSSMNRAMMVTEQEKPTKHVQLCYVMDGWMDERIDGNAMETVACCGLFSVFDSRTNEEGDSP